MDKEQLPNSTLILVMGILSILSCCCYGIVGLIFGIIAITLAIRATRLYKEAPENYSGYGNVQAGKIMGIIGVILSLFYIIFVILMYLSFGWEVMNDPLLMQQRMQELMGQ